MMENFHFIRPLWLLMAIPIALLWWRLFREQDARSAWKAMIAPHLLDHLLVENSKKSWLRPVYVLLALWALMTLALAGPTWMKEPSPLAEDTAGMYVLIKITPSMLGEDVQPSRLERAKQKLSDILDLRENSATGLIAYGGSAHLVMPLTRDGNIVNSMAQGLSPDTMPREGDSLGAALSLAADLFARTNTSGSVLIMADSVTPGQVSGGNLPQQINHMPVHFLAMNALGSQVDPGLQQAADTLGAQVTRLTVDASDVKEIHQQADRAMKKVLGEQHGDRWKDFGYFLAPIIALLALFWARRGFSL